MSKNGTSEEQEAAAAQPVPVRSKKAKIDPEALRELSSSSEDEEEDEEMAEEKAGEGVHAMDTNVLLKTMIASNEKHNKKGFQNFERGEIHT